MFLPLHDSTPLKVIRFQAVTLTIVALNVLIYLLTGAFTPEAVQASIATGWGLVPAELTGLLHTAPAYDPIPEPLTLITYQFLHAGWGHLLPNMLFLWIFADNIEDAYGHAAFAFLYLVSGVAAALAHVLLSPASGVPLIGASGAVSGILGAYMVLYPRARVWVFMFVPFPLRIGAVWVLGVWFALQFASFWADQGDAADTAVAWGAHIGGFLTGAVITYAIRRRLWMRLDG